MLQEFPRSTLAMPEQVNHSIIRPTTDPEPRKHLYILFDFVLSDQSDCFVFQVEPQSLGLPPSGQRRPQPNFRRFFP